MGKSKYQSIVLKLSFLQLELNVESSQLCAYARSEEVHRIGIRGSYRSDTGRGNNRTNTPWHMKHRMFIRKVKVKGKKVKKKDREDAKLGMKNPKVY